MSPMAAGWDGAGGEGAWPFPWDGLCGSFQVFTSVGDMEADSVVMRPFPPFGR